MKNRWSRCEVTGSRSACHKLTWTTVELRHLELKLALTVEVVAATAGDRTDHTTGRSAVLGSKSARFYLHLLDQLSRKIEGLVERSSSIIRNFLSIKCEN